VLHDLDRTLDGQRVVVVGAGVIGTMHALFALARGASVVHLERDLVPSGATVRNFGLIWVSGRAAGGEFALAQRARDLWSTSRLTYRASGFGPTVRSRWSTVSTNFKSWRRRCCAPTHTNAGSSCSTAKKSYDVIQHYRVSSSRAVLRARRRRGVAKRPRRASRPYGAHRSLRLSARTRTRRSQ